MSNPDTYGIGFFDLFLSRKKKKGVCYCEAKRINLSLTVDEEDWKCHCKKKCGGKCHPASALDPDDYDD